jgi:hypothetical protein
MRIIKGTDAQLEPASLKTPSKSGLLFERARPPRVKSEKADGYTKSNREIPVVEAFPRPFGVGEPGIDFLETPSSEKISVIHVDFTIRKRI